MRYFLIIFFCFSLCKASAQKAVSNIDTVYYLLDTASTPSRDRMWDIGVESSYKFFTIKCPCLKYNSEPTFIYNLKEPGQKISNNSVSKFNTVGLSSLIAFAKKTTDLTAQTLYIFYLIEKNNTNEYTIHKMRLLAPRKRAASIDYENIPPETVKKKND